MLLNRKHKYNPFFMKGSYIGLILGFIGSYFSFAIVFALAEVGRFTNLALLIPLVPALAGFLGGWGIHILIKKIKK